MPVPRCEEGHRLPDVVGYQYPDGRILCSGCQTFDAYPNGSPEGTVSLLREGVTIRVGGNIFAELPAGSSCAICADALPQPCRDCADPEADEAARVRRRELVAAQRA